MPTRKARQKNTLKRQVTRDRELFDTYTAENAGETEKLRNQRKEKRRRQKLRKKMAKEGKDIDGDAAMGDGMDEEAMVEKEGRKKTEKKAVVKSGWMRLPVGLGRPAPTMGDK